MGKRSSFERVPRDFYPTPAEAVRPLLPHLKPNTWFAEPCAGNGALIEALNDAGHFCGYAGDIEPRQASIDERDALTLTKGDWWAACDFIITNPPWSRDLLHPMIDHFSSIAPTWLLFDADWMHTKQATPFMPILHAVVSVGRVKWIPDSKMTGKDNCCWYLFNADPELALEYPAAFYGRQAA